jgi:hypothetical protein
MNTPNEIIYELNAERRKLEEPDDELIKEANSQGASGT